jgi:DNA primase
MPRIPDADVARLKQAVPLTRLAEARGVALSGQGRNLLGLCPFHDDKTPSLVIDPDKNLWNCLGACGCGGSNIDWVMREQGVGFRAAVEIIAGMAGLPGPTGPADPGPGPTRPSAPRLPNPLRLEAEGDVLLGEVADFYHRTLMENPLATAAPALAYLQARKLADPALLAHFRLGYADRSLGLRIPSKSVREGATLRIRLSRLGVLRDSGHELMTGAVVVPILGQPADLTALADQVASGDATLPPPPVVGLYGRMTCDRLRPGTVYHRYLAGPHRAAWNAAGCLEAATRTGDGSVILCEAILDGLTFWAAGFHAVTAAYGIHGFTDHHRALLAAPGVRSVFLAYDNDDPGNAAAATLADTLIAAGLSVYRVAFPAATKDANGLACASDDPAAALGACLRDADFLGGPARVAVPAGVPARAPAPPPVSVPPPASTPAREAAAKESNIAAVPVAGFPAAAAVPAAPRQPPTTSPTPEPSSLAASMLPVPSASSAPPAPPPPPSPSPSALLVQDGDDLKAVIGPRRYRLRDLLKNPSLSALRVGLRVTVATPSGLDAFHQDTLDLCQAKARMAFVTAAADATRSDPDALKADLARLLDAAESTWEADRRARAAAAGSSSGPTRPAMTPAAEAAARAFLRTPDLLGRIAADFDACGLVGDPAPKLVAYLCAVSRKLDHPLAVLTMAPSAAGKTSLQDATLAFVPEEDRLSVSAMTGQALHYLENDLAHRVLAIAEEEGASRAAYSLKLLQSEGKISLAVPIKDPESGQIVTKIKEVRGPVALFLTTTAPEIDEELANRCIVLTVDDSPEQTAKVHAAQRERETLDGLLARHRASALRALHHDAQRLLEPVAVVNPYARTLTFRADRPRTRRDHTKYLGLIRTIAFLHQYQRPRHTLPAPDGQTLTYIEVTPSDIAAANRLAAAVLGRSLDELAPQTRTLLLRLHAWVHTRAEAECRPPGTLRFTRREVREFTAWSADQIDLHLGRLERLEYVLAHHGGQGARYVYSLAYDGQGQDGGLFLMGLSEATMPTSVPIPATSDPPPAWFRTPISDTGSPAITAASASLAADFRTSGQPHNGPLSTLGIAS